jgi:hypothetical protein
MTRSTPVALALLALLAPLLRADEPAARAALEEAHALAASFRDASYRTDAEAQAARAAFARALDAAQARLSELPGPARTAIAPALDRVVIDAAFTTATTTRGLDAKVALLDETEALARLGPDALVREAFTRVHAEWLTPTTGFGCPFDADLPRVVERIRGRFAATTAALRALVPDRTRYVAALAPHHDEAVDRIRGKVVRAPHARRPLRDVGTRVDAAWANARRPGGEFERFARIEASGLPARRAPGEELAVRLTVELLDLPPLVRTDVELIGPAGECLQTRTLIQDPPCRSAQPTTAVTIPADRAPGACRVLVTLLLEDGSVRAREFDVEVVAPPATVGLIGAVARSAPADGVTLSGLAASYVPGEELVVQVELRSAGAPYSSCEARIVDANGADAGQVEVAGGDRSRPEASLRFELFAPLKTGDYSVVVRATRTDGSVQRATGAFRVVIRRDRRVS